MQIFDIAESDLDNVVALNQASLPHVSSMDPERTRWFAEYAHYFRVARIDGQLAGFLIGLRPGIDYASQYVLAAIVASCDRFVSFT